MCMLRNCSIFRGSPWQTDSTVSQSKYCHTIKSVTIGTAAFLDVNIGVRANLSRMSRWDSPCIPCPAVCLASCRKPHVKTKRPRWPLTPACLDGSERQTDVIRERSWERGLSLLLALQPGLPSIQKAKAQTTDCCYSERGGSETRISARYLKSASFVSTRGMFSDQTPTPTRFLQNCEEVGLFKEIEEEFLQEQEEEKNKKVHIE